MNKKSDALDNFIKMIESSWTYEKLTRQEKEQLYETFYHTITNEAVKGNYDTRWKILQAIYHSFLKGCGYNSFNWREDAKNDD